MSRFLNTTSNLFVGSMVTASAPALPRTFVSLDHWVTAGTGLSTTGSLVNSWTDPVTGKVWSAAGGTRPTASTESGLACPLFVPANSTAMTMSKSIAVSDSFTMFFVVRVVDNDNTQGLCLQEGAAGVDTGYFYTDIANETQYAQRLTATGANQISGADGLGGAFHVLAWVSSPARLAIFKDGVKGAEDLTTGNLSNAILTLTMGSLNIAGYFLDGPIVEEALFMENMSDANVTLLSTYFATRWGI